jgi:hypothetical protein
MPAPHIDDEMGTGTTLTVLPDRDGDMLVVMESADFRQRLVVEITRSPLRRPQTHAALKALAQAIVDEGCAAEELRADFTKALPGGAIDDSTFEAVEEALDRAEAPARGEDGHWLTLPERVASLAGEIEHLRAVNKVLPEALAALKSLEDACEARATVRPQNIYDAELAAGMGDILNEMDFARRRARQLVRDLAAI